jgi:UDP-N-acetylmuramoylalanine--D-glutamate ligase
MKLSDLTGRNVLVLGLGREGKAALECLARTVPSAKVIGADDNTAHAALSLEDAVSQATEDTVVIKSPGIPPTHPCFDLLKKRALPVTSSTDLFFHERKGKRCVIAITGTKGKSTTASLLAHTLRTAGFAVELVGNIGLPSLARVDAPEDTVFVCETSSYQAMDVTVGPDICVVLNLYAEHMDYHGTVDAYWDAKLNMVRRQKEGDVFVYDSRFPQLVDAARETEAATVACNDFSFSAIDLLPLFGEHNRENARAVVAVARRFDVTDDVLEEAFRSFEPLPHRLEPVGDVGGVLFVNDSISTVPQATLAAMQAFEGKLGALIVGGKDRGYDFSDLAQALATCPDTLVFILPGGERMQEEFKKHGVAYQVVSGLSEAVETCVVRVPVGRVCLLSPASPSYGFFKNFEDRGEQFRALVERHSP